MMSRVYFSVYVIAVSAIIFGIFEIGIRNFYPEINYQGNEASLFQEKKFHNSMGYLNNSKGEIFGKMSYTDELGFRKMESPSDYDKSWLLLGDSVGFGVGVETEDTFAQLIQNYYPKKKIFNSAVVGYSAVNYPDVVDIFLNDHEEVERVILFFCLNDVYGNLTLKRTSIPIKERILSFLRTNSKLYLFLKKQFFDRSKAFALYDIGLYTEDNQDLKEYLDAVDQIDSTLEEKGIEFMVVILPYEYQLRLKGLTAPQELLNKYFAEHSINSTDLFDDFSSLDSEAYFLYGDPMHLSAHGHKVVAERVLEEIKE